MRIRNRKNSIRVEDGDREGWSGPKEIIKRIRIIWAMESELKVINIIKIDNDSRMILYR